jgi:hypothetical protein
MTDARSQTATGTIRGTQFDIEVRITCRNDGRIEYSLSAFDKTGQPAEMRSWTQFRNQSAIRKVDFQVRADTASAFTFSAAPQFVNQATFATVSQTAGQFGPQGLPWEEYALRIAGSRRVTARLPILSGEATIHIDQTGSIVRGVLDPCIEQLARSRQQYEAAEARRVTEEAAREAERRRRERLEQQASGITEGL